MYKFYNYRPYSHQLKTIEFILRHKRAYIFNDLGSGKSLSMLWALDMLMEAGKISKVLIISPLSIMECVWATEIKTQIPNRSYSIAHGTRDKRLKALDKKAHFYLTNTDATRTYTAEFIKAKFDVIVIDEVTGYKTFCSQRSKGAAKLCATVKAVYGMTGTPVASGPLSAFGIAKVVNPDRLPTKYITKFRALTMQQISEFDWVPKDGWEDVVKATLYPSIRFELDQCIDLPPIVFEDRHIEMSSKQRKLYKKMFDTQVIEFNEGLITASTAGVRFSKLLQIAAGIIIDNESNSEQLMPVAKLAETLVILEETVNRKLVIFVHFTEVGRMINEFLTSKKVKSVFVCGDTPVRQRAVYFEQFQTGDLEVIVLQSRTASHGITLTAAGVCLFFGCPLGTETYLQCIGRIRRTGQDKRQVIIRLSSSKVERRIFSKLQDEEMSAQSLLDLYAE